ncbi:hypothetical protein BGY98DRAFT_1094994 [Russula aff. rugulosa BPL654]|nr:hypothetical protein BGY98DRAFT_1094994 [Russula aff. rugulosa BPL654]
MAPSTTLPSPARNKKGRQSSSAPHREVLVGASIMLVSSTRWRFSSYARAREPRQPCSRQVAVFACALIALAESAPSIAWSPGLQNSRHTEHPLHAIFMNCPTKIAKVITIALSSLIASLVHRLPLCDPGYHPNNQRPHVTWCRHTAQDPPDSRHRYPFTADYSQTYVLSSAARAAFAIVEDLCPLSNEERPQFLQLDTATLPQVCLSSPLPIRDFIPSSNYYNTLFPLLLKPPFKRSAFPLASCGIRIVFVLLKRFSSELKTEIKVSLTPLIKLILAFGKTAGGPWSEWMRVLAMEIMRSIDQLDKADVPLFPEAYIHLRGLPPSFPLYNTLAVQKLPTDSTEPVRAPGPLDPMTLPETKPTRIGLQTVRAMLNAGSPAHLARCNARSRRRVPYCPAKAALPRRRTTHRNTLHLRYTSPSKLRDSRSVCGSWRRTTATRTLARYLGCLRTLVAAALFLPERLAQAGSRYLRRSHMYLATRCTAPGPAPLGTEARLGGVTAFNIQRLVYRPPDVAWDAITSYLLFILLHPAAPARIPVQAACTLDNILEFVPRDLMAAPSELQATAASRVRRSGTADDTGWTRIEREHGAPPVGMHPVYAIIPFFSFRFFRSYTYYSLAETVYEVLVVEVVFGDVGD